MVEKSIEFDDSLYGKKLNAIPVDKTEIGIDLDNKFINELSEAGQANSLDLGAIERFTTVAQDRESQYEMIDVMCQDSMMSAVVELCAEDATESNDAGRIVWATSDDANVSQMVTFLLDNLNVDKHIYKWVYSLCKYGDLYIKLYRESDVVDPIFGNPFNINSDRTLNENVNVTAYSKNDHYVDYIEMENNPAEVFELVRFGKSFGYIKAPVRTPIAQDNYLFTNYVYNYKDTDVDVTSAKEYVHAALEDDIQRDTEEVHLYFDNYPNGDENIKDTEKASYVSYNVRKGKSILADSFKLWRELMLLENSVLLNRLTKSSVVRVIGVQVGDIPQANVRAQVAKVKQLFEQKTSMNDATAYNEYTNPGPLQNTVYMPVRGELNSITATEIGGDVDVKSLEDLDYFRSKLLGSLGIPKQYLGFTDDSTGFNGGTSLSLISSKYAKLIKRIQATVCQLVTDMLNLFLIDRGCEEYINKFQIHMLPPTTQEEIDRRDNLSNRIRFASDIMGMLNDIENPVARMKILKTLLSEVVSNDEVLSVIQEEIDKLDVAENEEEDMGDGFEDMSDEEPLGLGGSDELPSMNDFATQPEEMVEEDVEVEEALQMTLPNPLELGIDFTQTDSDEL